MPTMPTMPTMPSGLIRTCDGMYPENCKVVQPSCTPLGSGFIGNTSTVGLIRPM